MLKSFNLKGLVYVLAASFAVNPNVKLYAGKGQGTVDGNLNDIIDAYNDESSELHATAVEFVESKINSQPPYFVLASEGEKTAAELKVLVAELEAKVVAFEKGPKLAKEFKDQIDALKTENEALKAELETLKKGGTE